MLMTYSTSGTPEAEGTIRGLAQAPLHLHNMVAELVDNALAASPENPHVWIRLSKDTEGGDLYVLEVWDDGPGIPLDRLQSKVFTLGSRAGTGSHLNEHGFGLKNVLAKVQQLTQRDWIFATRDAEVLAAGNFYRCKRPLGFSMPIEAVAEAEWPIPASRKTGTYIRFHLPLTYLQTVVSGRRGGPPRDIGKIATYLREHLGVLYRGYLEGGRRSIAEISTALDGGVFEPIDAVVPDYKSKASYPFTVSIGGVKLVVEGEIGVIDKNGTETHKRLYYYRHAPESQGIDIRVGNRVVATRLITEIWDRDRHPSLNGIAGEFRVPVVDGVVPPTLNNKTSLDLDSPIWIALAEAIAVECPDEKLPQGGGKSEDDLRDELFQHIQGLARADHLVEKEYDAGHGVYVDILWDQKATGGGVDIYEVKKGKAQAGDVYQLLMYWDALVDTGIQPTHAHLVANGHGSGVAPFIALINGRKDSKGKKYNLQKDDWRQHGITP
jgi:hypothetical protein